MYIKPKGNRKVFFVVLELAAVGDMFDVVCNSGPL